MSPSHESAVCRIAYGSARRRGAPVVMITHLAKDFAVAETNDGRVRIEAGVAGARCCIWALKCECASVWLCDYGGN
jgi:hypothetical protein